jgi:hypothetical protein
LTFPDCLVISVGGRIRWAWGLLADRTGCQVTPRGQIVRPCNTRAQVRQPNAAEDATARPMFHRTQLASKRSRTAARSAMRSGSPAAASSLSSPPCRSRHRSAHSPVRGRWPVRSPRGDQLEPASLRECSRRRRHRRSPFARELSACRLNDALSLLTVHLLTSYSLRCLEGQFSEVQLLVYGVLRS